MDQPSFSDVLRVRGDDAFAFVSFFYDRGPADEQVLSALKRALANLGLEHLVASLMIARDWAPEHGAWLRRIFRERGLL